MNNLTAYDAFEMILDTNELIEHLKSTNTDNVPNLNTCKEVELLIKYRQLLAQVMKKTILGVFEDDSERVKD